MDDARRGEQGRRRLFTGVGGVGSSTDAREVLRQQDLQVVEAPRRDEAHGHVFWVVAVAPERQEPLADLGHLQGLEAARGEVREGVVLVRRLPQHLVGPPAVVVQVFAMLGVHRVHLPVYTGLQQKGLAKKPREAVQGASEGLIHDVKLEARLLAARRRVRRPRVPRDVLLVGVVFPVRLRALEQHVLEEVGEARNIGIGVGADAHTQRGGGLVRRRVPHQDAADAVGELREAERPIIAQRFARLTQTLEAEGRRALGRRRRAQAAEVALGHVDFAAVAAAGRLVGPAGAGDEE